jgi:tRNA pseudouridine38-40 synthase
MEKFLLGMEYDGTDFRGFQIQPVSRTVQGELESALETVLHVPTRITGAGRTDAGVHAKGQTASFSGEWRWPLNDLTAALNANLPADMVVRWAQRVPDSFDARHCARGRAYRYIVERAAQRSAFSARYSYRVVRELDLDRISKALQLAVGTHDFGAFGVAPAEQAGETGTVRTLYRVRCSASGRWLWLDYVGNAFLRHMVRTLTGAVLKVGTGQMDLTEFQGLVHRRGGDVRTPYAVPACGLWLMKVLY